jgi:primosomal protein N' (replication factor Y)
MVIAMRSKHQARGELSMQTLAKRLSEGLPDGVTLGDPAPAPLEKSHGQFRFHLMLRTKSILRLAAHVRAVLDKLTLPEEVFVTVDVDAYQLM